MPSAPSEGTVVEGAGGSVPGITCTGDSETGYHMEPTSRRILRRLGLMKLLAFYARVPLDNPDGGDWRTPSGDVPCLEQGTGEKGDPQRFQGTGINFKAKLIGVEDVAQANGDKMCQEAIQRLKAAVKESGDHKLRLVINVSMQGMKLIEEKTETVLHTHAVHRISFISRDVSDNRAFGYIYGPGDGTHKFFGIKTDKAAEGLVLTLRDLFQVVFEMKKREVEEAKKSRKGQEMGSLQEGHYDGKSVSDPSTPDLPSVGDLLDLEFELSTLEQGIQQMNAFVPTSPGAVSGVSSDVWSGSAPSTPRSQPVTPHTPLTFHSTAGAVPYRPTESSITVNLPVSPDNDPFVVQSKPMLTPQPASYQWATAFTPAAHTSVSTSTMTSPPLRESAGGQLASVVQLSTVQPSTTQSVLTEVSYTPVVMGQPNMPTAGHTPTTVMLSMATGIPPGAMVVVPLSSSAVFSSPSNASVVPNQLPQPLQQQTPVNWMTFANSPSPPGVVVGTVAPPRVPTAAVFPQQQSVFVAGASAAPSQQDPFKEDLFAGDRYAAFCQMNAPVSSTNPFADAGNFGDVKPAMSEAPPKPQRLNAEKKEADDPFKDLATVGTGKTTEEFFPIPPKSTLSELAAANNAAQKGPAPGQEVFGQFPGSNTVSTHPSDPFDTSHPFQLPPADVARPGGGEARESRDSSPEESLPLPAVPPPPLPRMSSFDPSAIAPELPPRPSTSCSLTTPATPPTHKRPSASLLRQQTLPTLEPINKSPLTSRVLQRQSTLPVEAPPPPPPRRKVSQPAVVLKTTLPQHSSTTPSPPQARVASSVPKPTPLAAVSGGDPFAVSLHQSKPTKNSASSSIARPRPRPRSQTPNSAKQMALAAKPESPIPVPSHSSDADSLGFKVDPFSSPSQHSVSSDTSRRLDDSGRLSTPLSGAIIDPFLNVDPFSKDPFAEQDPFASDEQSDPFASDFANDVIFRTESVVVDDVGGSCSTPFEIGNDPFADDPFFTSSSTDTPPKPAADNGTSCSGDQSEHKDDTPAKDTSSSDTKFDSNNVFNVTSNDTTPANIDSFSMSSLSMKTPDFLGSFIENQLMSLSKPAGPQPTGSEDNAAKSQDVGDGVGPTTANHTADSTAHTALRLPADSAVERDHDTSSSSGISSETSAADSAQTLVLQQSGSLVHKSTVSNGHVVGEDEEPDCSSC